MISGESDPKADKGVTVRSTINGSSDPHSNPLPSISLPKGGGAIRDMICQRFAG